MIFGVRRRAMRTLASAALGVASAALGVPGSAHPPAAVAQGSRAVVEAAFTPADDVAGLIVQRIAAARESVRMEAYLFTDRRIANALLAARRRGVAVDVIADAAQHAAGGLPFLAALHRAGARVYLDSNHAAMHNKILIIDAGRAEAAVITGSYNFTPSAQARNAENVVVISASRALTGRFAAHFEEQRGQSTPWRPASTSPP